MASDSQITGFDADAVRAGLRLAMQVGLPVNSSDQPTFYMPVTTTTDGSHNVGSDGVPFSASYRTTKSPRQHYQVPVAIEYKDGAGKLEGFGVVQPSGVVLTFLDQDYAVIKGFEYCVIAGQRYWYASTEVAQALIDVGIWRVHCRSDDEG